ncbi:MAG: fibrillarin-like rRNA/tRNA 2'-O-methyltransferase [Methanobacteriaceae archaeon]|nr:fibrillarin-like rRNA/tRNA 2'-O-methyltransferase [Methanobacteriaceae archaeon]
MEMSERFEGVYQINDSIATINLNPGIKVYGEKLIELEDTEYRLWDPRRSKLCAAIKNGQNIFPFKKESKILYLGASAGTTPSHISDIAYNGIVYCVEFSPRIMRDLMELCKHRKNMVPCLEDATQPPNYLSILEKVDIIYCDVAQPKQSELFMDNMHLYLKEDGYGIIIIKSRSIDVTKNPKKIFREEEGKLKRNGYRILEKINLYPYEKDHMAFLCQIDF